MGAVFLWPLESEHRYTHAHTQTHTSTVNMKMTVGWEQKRDRYEEGNKKNIQGLETLPA